MSDKRKFGLDKPLRQDFYKESSNADPMLTFQPKSAPINQYLPPKPSFPINDIRKDRQLANKAYFQEFTRKNNSSKLPSVSNFSCLSSSAFPSNNQETSRFCLRSDNKPSRSKKKDLIEAMNASSLVFGKQEDFETKETGQTFKKLIGMPEKPATPKKDFDEAGQVKTPTFNTSRDEKIEYLQEAYKFGRDKESNRKVSLFDPKRDTKYSDIRQDIKMPKISKNFNKIDLNKIEGIKEPSSASKYSAIGSSISTDFPLPSPSNASDKGFFKSYVSQDLINNNEIRLKNDSPFKNRRDHPKIRVRKNGFPKDVFTLKHK